MTSPHFILADGTGAIVSLVFFVVLWIVGQVAASIEANKKKRQQQSSLPPPEEYDSGPVIIVNDEPARRPPPMPKQKKRRQQPAAPAVARVDVPGAGRAEPDMASEYTTEAHRAHYQNEAISNSSRTDLSESARNVRLMLQKGGVREAIILNEVLGKPKSMQDP